MSFNIATTAKQRLFNTVAKEDELERYRAVVSEYFSELGMVAFGQIKFVASKNDSDEIVYNWETVDKFIDLVQALGLKAHYNTVINNKDSFPEWYWSFDQETKKAFLEEHVTTVVGKYSAKFHMFKLINEIVRDEEENFLGTELERIEIVTHLFKLAKQQAPDTLMMINDFGNFYRDDVREAYIRLINDVLQRDGPIDVVGLQGHMWTFEMPSDERIRSVISEVHEKTGLPIYITEFDLSFDNTIHGGKKIDPHRPFIMSTGVQYDTWFEYQAFAYKHFLELCEDMDYVHGVTFWECCDQNVPWERPSIGVFDENCQEKPEFTGLYKRLRELK